MPNIEGFCEKKYSEEKLTKDEFKNRFTAQFSVDRIRVFP